MLNFLNSQERIILKSLIRLSLLSNRCYNWFVVRHIWRVFVSKHKHTFHSCTLVETQMTGIFTVYKSSDDMSY